MSRDAERCTTTGGLVDACRHCTEPEEATVPELYPLKPFSLDEWDHLESVEERPAVEGTTDDDRPWLPLDGDQERVDDRPCLCGHVAYDGAAAECEVHQLW